jgi:hypothetical protein
MNSLKYVALSLLACGLMMPNASAGIILDQSNLPGQNFYNPLGPTFVPGESTAEMAQIFTPGVTGQITGISVDLLSLNNINGGTVISLELVSVNGGLPDTSAPLSAAVTANVPAGTAFFTFDLSPLNINLTGGTSVAYWLTGDPANGFSRWLSSNGQSYSGGQTYFRFPGATDGEPTNFFALRESAYFQTFMETPEPSTAAIVGLGLLALGLGRRRGAKQLSN